MKARLAELGSEHHDHRRRPNSANYIADETEKWAQGGPKFAGIKAD